MALIVSKMKVISQDSKNKHMFMIKVGVNIFWSCTKYNINNFKDILKFLFGPKYLRKYFCISALASKMGQIKKKRMQIIILDDK